EGGGGGRGGGSAAGGGASRRKRGSSRRARGPHPLRAPRPAASPPSVQPLASGRGQGLGLAPRGAAQGARRLGRFLSRVRRRAALVRGVRGRGSRALRPVRRRDSAPVSVVRRALLVGGHRRLRVVRRPAARER